MRLARCEMVEANEQQRERMEREDERLRRVEEQRTVEERERARHLEASRVAEPYEARRTEYDVSFAEIRRAPPHPELGGTLAEAALFCARAGGSMNRFEATESTGFICTLEGAPIFAGNLGAAGVIDEVRVWYEDLDSFAYRHRLTEQLGTPDESIDANGLRVWEWFSDSMSLRLQSYARGSLVRLRLLARMPSP